jgi:hypothetical protein
MSVSGCNPRYAQIDLTLTSPSNRSGYTTVYNNPGQTSIEAVVSLPINGDVGTWTANADYTSDNTYYQSQTLQVKGTVQITSVGVPPTPINTNSPPGPACTTVTVQIAVNKVGLADNPVLNLSYFKNSSSPASITLDISPTGDPSLQLAASGSTTFQVCNGANSTTGSYTIQAAINSVMPSDKFTVLPPQAGASTAPITVSSF